MFTILLAWINAHYNCGYHLLFLGTVIIDLAVFDTISEFIKK